MKNTNFLYIKITRFFIICFTLIYFSSVSAFALTLTYDGSTHEYNALPIVLKINGSVLDQSTLPMQPIIIDGTTLVPVREVFENLGAVVDYKEQSKEVYIGHNNSLIVMQIGNDTYTVDGVPYTFKIAPKIINGKTMIPLRAVSEGIGLNVDWDNATRTISITSTIPVIDVLPEPTPTPVPTDIPVPTPTPTPVVTPDVSTNIINAVDKSQSGFTDAVFPITTVNNIITNQNSIVISSDSSITSVKKLLLPDNRLVLDITNSVNGLGSTFNIPNNSYYSGIRSSQYETVPTYVSRVVIDLKSGVFFATSMSNDRKNIIINFGDENTVFSNNTDIIPPSDNTANFDPNKPVYFDTVNHSLVISKSTGVTLQNINIDDYTAFNKEIFINLNGNYSSYLGFGLVPVTDTNFKSYEIYENGGTVIKVCLNSWGTLKTYETNTHIVIDFINPKKLYDKILIIDAGHGGTDAGTVGGSLKEKDLNYTVANRFYKLVDEQTDIKVYFTRTSDTRLDLKQIGQFASVMGDLLFSVHTNGFYTDVPNGIEVLYLEHSNDATIGISSKEIAKIVDKNLASASGLYDRGVKRSELVIFKNSTIPSVLGEMGFITNKKDYAKLADDNYLTTVAESYKKSVIEVFQIYTPKR